MRPPRQPDVPRLDQHVVVGRCNVDSRRLDRRAVDGGHRRYRGRDGPTRAERNDVRTLCARTLENPFAQLLRRRRSLDAVRERGCDVRKRVKVLDRNALKSASAGPVG